MSVYSGFATRQQETFYDKLIEKLVELLCEKVLHIYNGHLGDERMFAKKIVKIHKTLLKMDEQKYLQPLMSVPIAELATYLRKNFSASNSTAISSVSFVDNVGKSHSTRKLPNSQNGFYNEMDLQGQNYQSQSPHKSNFNSIINEPKDAYNSLAINKNHGKHSTNKSLTSNERSKFLKGKQDTKIIEMVNEEDEDNVMSFKHQSQTISNNIKLKEGVNNNWYSQKKGSSTQVIDYDQKFNELRNEYSLAKINQRNKYILGNNNAFNQKKRSTQREYDKSQNQNKLLGNDFMSRRSTQNKTEIKSDLQKLNISNTANNKRRVDGYNNIIFQDKLLEQSQSVGPLALKQFQDVSSMMNAYGERISRNTTSSKMQNLTQSFTSNQMPKIQLKKSQKEIKSKNVLLQQTYSNSLMKNLKETQFNKRRILMPNEDCLDNNSKSILDISLF